MSKNDDILEAARKRMKEAAEADRENRLEELDDLEKLVGKQWDEKTRAQRELEGKPCLTFNRNPQFVRQVTGDIRRMNPAIKVLPADDNALQETAEIYEGLIRQIEYASDASSVYERAAEQAAASSIGWFRILTRYESEDSFEQECYIKSIRNPLSVYCDPSAEMPTREDANYLFITEQMRKSDFEEAYPGKSPEPVDHDSVTDGREHWWMGEKIVVAEYYWKEPVTRKIVMLETGQVMTKKDYDEAASRTVGPVPRIVRERTVDTHKVMWAKISGKDILEGPKEVPCYYIPVFAVTGEEWHIGDRTYRSSVIRYAKDAQQMYNFFRSSQAEFAALQPKAPYILTKKQVQGHEEYWNSANDKNFPYLLYNPDERAPGTPQRATPPLSSQALFDQAMIAAEDMKATTGIYDAALGNRSNENSGVAIRQRQMESDVSTSIYADNMGKAIAACGRALISMIPQVYDTQRSVRLLSEDGTEKVERINGQMIQGGMPVPVNDLTVGRYDIRVTMGPNYSTRRQEVAEGMLGFIQAVPGAAAVTADLIASAMDWPDADKFAERLARSMPPGMRDPETMSPEEQQAAQQAMQVQAQQMARQDAIADAEVMKTRAEAEESAADARKTQIEAAQAALELALQNGQINAVIQQAVSVAVARALQMQGQPRLMPPN